MKYDPAQCNQFIQCQDLNDIVFILTAFLAYAAPSIIDIIY